MITIHIVDPNGWQEKLKIPVNLNLSLMEVLKANGCPVLGTCGGIALCATCAVKVLTGSQNLPPAMDQELDMLDMLPQIDGTMRLACQLRIGPEMDGIAISMTGENENL